MKSRDLMRVVVVSIATLIQQTAMPTNSSLRVADVAEARSDNSRSFTAPDPWGVLQDIVHDVNGGFVGWQSGCDALEETSASCMQPGELFHVLSNRVSAGGRLKRVAPLKRAPADAQDDVSCNAADTQPEDALWFNETAAASSHNVLDSGLNYPSGPQAVPTNIYFSIGSEIIRAEFEVIPNQKTGKVCLHLYDTTVTDNWQQDVFPTRQVDLDQTTCPAQLPSGAVPIGCFYSPTLTPENLRFYQGPGVARPLTTQDTILLLGFHVIKKVDSNHWVWSTFWWQAEREPSSQAKPIGAHVCTAGACESLTSQWGNYVMNYVDDPSDSMTIAPVFNPYLDGSTANAPNTNCLVCHSFAAAHGQLLARSSPSFGAMGIVTRSKFNGVLANYFRPSMLKTDKVWSIALRIDNSASVEPGHAQAH